MLIINSKYKIAGLTGEWTLIEIDNDFAIFTSPDSVDTLSYPSHLAHLANQAGEIEFIVTDEPDWPGGTRPNVLLARENWF